MQGIFHRTVLATGFTNEQSHISMPVEMVTRRLREDSDERGIMVYGNKFRPDLAGPH